MTTLSKEMLKRLRQWDKAVAHTYAVNAVEAGVSVAPGPEKSDTSTGRSRASIATSAADPATYDPGEMVSYPFPDQRSAIHGISNRRHGESVFVDMGVDYREFVEENYGVIQTSHVAGTSSIVDNKSIGGILSGKS